jgi:hypothetical protein
MRLRPAALAVALALLAAPAAAQDFEAGHAAYKKGDFRTAVEVWRPLAEAGNPAAQLSLGVLYYHGRGVPRDFAEAVKWYRRAAAQDNVAAQVVLGFMYFQGDGVAQDHSAAARWFRRGGEQGNRFAQNALGVMYRDGLGVPLDFVQAYMWLDLAARQGDAEAARNRDLIAEKMTPGYVGRARRMVREWLAAHGESPAPGENERLAP